MEALYTLDSPPVVAFHLRFRVEGGRRLLVSAGFVKLSPGFEVQGLVGFGFRV